MPSAFVAIRFRTAPQARRAKISCANRLKIGMFHAFSAKIENIAQRLCNKCEYHAFATILRRESARPHCAPAFAQSAMRLRRALSAYRPIRARFGLWQSHTPALRSGFCAKRNAPSPRPIGISADTGAFRAMAKPYARIALRLLRKAQCAFAAPYRHIGRYGRVSGYGKAIRPHCAPAFAQSAKRLRFFAASLPNLMHCRKDFSFFKWLFARICLELTFCRQTARRRRLCPAACFAPEIRF